MNNTPFRIGLLINPLAGLGGPSALKGSDGKAIVAQALAAGTVALAQQRAAVALQALSDYLPDIHCYCAPGPMGADVARACGFDVSIVGELTSNTTSATDTKRLAGALVATGIDCLVFVGGDGTARDIYHAIGSGQLALGIPAGGKMHSGVYAISPQAAARVLGSLVRGEPVSVSLCEVRDIDEYALRDGRILSQYYGELLVPNDNRYVQQVKNSGRLSEVSCQEDIAATLIDALDATTETETLYVVGPGTTTLAFLVLQGLEGTLLGVDLVRNGQCIACDVDAHTLGAHLTEHTGAVVALITATGGQGHIIGRGNQQITAAHWHTIGRENLRVLITPSKLGELAGRPLLMDSGDPLLDRQWSGLIPVLTGYQQSVMYPLSCGDE